MKMKLIALIILCFSTGGANAQKFTPQRENIISFSPLILNETGYGSGLSFEHFLGGKNWMSYILPVSVNINNNGNIPGNMFYFSPGIKFYTNNNFSWRRAKFSIGPSLVLAAGKESGTDYNLYNNNYSGIYYKQSHFMYGFQLMAGFNYFILPQVYLGIDGGLGVTAVNNFESNSSAGAIVLRTFSVKIGYMFNFQNHASVKGFPYSSPETPR